MDFVQETPFVYNQIAALGVPAQVWDLVIEELGDRLKDYDEGFDSMTLPAFDELQFDWTARQTKLLDYERAPGMSDHDYARSLLLQAEARRNPN